MRILVETVRPIKKYKLAVTFNDGKEGVVDLSHLAGEGVFKIWDEKNNFSKVFISEESRAITWPGGIDIDTYNIYSTITGLHPKEFLNPQRQDATHL